MELKVEKREILGKKVNSLREQGLLPAELYGHGVANLHLVVNSKDFEKVYRKAGENTVVNVIVDGVLKPALIYEVQTDPLTGATQAVDFYEVNMNEAIETTVPLEFVGESSVVKEGAGVFIKAMDEIEVEALPGDIPSKIIVDISRLTSVGDSIYVKDLPVTDKFKFTVDLENVVASIAELAKEEEIKTEVTPDQVIVETEEKKAVREAAKSSAGDNEA